MKHADPAAALLGLALLAGVAAAYAEEPIFREVAADVGLDFVHRNGMVGKLYFPEMMGASAALLDYDNDGDLDVYLGQGAALDRQTRAEPSAEPLGDRLFRNELIATADGATEGALRFTDVSKTSGLSATGYAMGVATGDYDNDGLVDLYVANLGANQLLHNQGDGTFADVTARSGAGDSGWSVPALFLDFDRDGWLDLFVGNYVIYDALSHKQCLGPNGSIDYCAPTAFGPQANHLFRNRGDGTFEDVTARALVGAVPGRSLGVVAGDFDGDGWLDLYVANDEMPNVLWLNQRDGTFRNEAMLAGAAVSGDGLAQASMGVVAGDFDGDGLEDLFMTHLRRDMNTLYLNRGGAIFDDRSRPSGLGRRSWANTGFGIALFDYDNDGVFDLYVANGAVRLKEDLLAAGDSYPLREPNQLFRGLGDARFVEVEEFVEPAQRPQVSRAVAVGDIDNDGDADLLVANNAGPTRLLVNRVGSRRPWIGFRLQPRGVERDALGALVAIRRGGAPVVAHRVRTGGSYGAARDPRIVVGLHDGEPIDEIEVWWPSGRRERFGGRVLAPGSYSTVREGEGSPLNGQ